LVRTASGRFRVPAPSAVIVALPEAVPLSEKVNVPEKLSVTVFPYEKG
jgi:hypothetical protein